jgi:hypothetical protein
MTTIPIMRMPRMMRMLRMMMVMMAMMPMNDDDDEWAVEGRGERRDDSLAVGVKSTDEGIER